MNYGNGLMWINKSMDEQTLLTEIWNICLLMMGNDINCAGMSCTDYINSELLLKLHIGLSL